MRFGFRFCAVRDSLMLRHRHRGARWQDRGMIARRTCCVRRSIRSSTWAIRWCSWRTRSTGDSSTDAIRESLSVTHKTGAIETKGLQTTAVFAPRDDQAMPSDTPGAQQISVAALTSTMRAGAMDRIIARLGDACAAPFAVLGLPPVRQREIARFPGYFGFTFTRSTRWSLISPEPRLRLYSRSGAQEGRFRIAPSAEVTSLRHQVGGDLTNLLRGQVLRILVHDLVSPRR